MKSSLIIISIFVTGFLAGLFAILPNAFTGGEISTYLLYILIVLVGIELGSKNIKEIFRKVDLMTFLLPLATITGTFLFAALISFLLPQWNIKEVLAVSAGFGWYSLSGILIAQLHSQTLGLIALLSNITREIFTFCFSGFIVKKFGPLALISTAGATSMDSTLPVISRFAGPNFVVTSLIHGIILTILVPIFVPFFLHPPF